MEKEKMTKPSNINVQTPLLQPSNRTHQNLNQSNNDKINHDYIQKKLQHLTKEQSQLEITNNVVVNVDGEDSEPHDPELDKFLKQLEFYLRILGFDQTTPLKFALCWVVFFVVGIAVPVLIIELTHCFECDEFQMKDFEYEILTSHLLLSGVSLICVAYNIISNRGFRRFLFVDRQKGYTLRFKDQYIKKIKGFYRLLFQSLIPCCILKAVHEIMRMIFLQRHSWVLAIFNASALIISWTYLSLISLAACMLFHLACSLQVIHFNDYAKHLENESSITNLMDEHMRLREYLSKISHRFRIYLILVFLLVTASLCMTLVQITGVNGKVTFLNGGNFAVTSIVQVVETLLCLHAGTKISSRAQGIGAVACRWHALVTCKSPEGSKRSLSLNSLSSSSSDSDLCLLDENSIVIHPQSAPVSSYNRRQSFVMYLQTNPGGLTLYGWTVDRSLLSTIFAVELSLVLFVLGQTIVFSE
ncbi:Beta-2 adrenergic receptor [Bienertia sinuspersici]